MFAKPGQNLINVVCLMSSAFKVSKVIIEMGLKNVADSRIGGSIIRGISGGEKRRVTIAVQLLQNPSMSKIIHVSIFTCNKLEPFSERILFKALSGNIIINSLYKAY